MFHLEPHEVDERTYRILSERLADLTGAMRSITHAAVIGAPAPARALLEKQLAVAEAMDAVATAVWGPGSNAYAVMRRWHHGNDAERAGWDSLREGIVIFYDRPGQLQQGRTPEEIERKDIEELQYWVGSHCRNARSGEDHWRDTRAGIEVFKRHICEAITGNAPGDADAASSPVTEPQKLKPRWDAKRKTLLLGGIAVKQYKYAPAENQAKLLAAFQSKRWPRRIPCPFNDDRARAQTIRDLNKALPHPTIHFKGDGQEGVEWERDIPDNS